MTKLPVAFCGGRRARVWPVPIVKPEIRPRNTFRLPYMSTSRSALWPILMSASCVSLKLASIQISESERTVMRAWPTATLLPGLTFLRATTPSISARTSQ